MNPYIIFLKNIETKKNENVIIKKTLPKMI